MSTPSCDGKVDRPTAADNVSSSKIKLGATKSLPAFQSGDGVIVANDGDGDIVKKQTQSSTPMPTKARPRLQSRTSFQFNEGLRKQGSVDFTTPRPRIFSKSKEVQTTKPEHNNNSVDPVATTPVEHQNDCPRPELDNSNMVHRCTRTLKRQHTLDTILDVDQPNGDEDNVFSKEMEEEVDQSKTHPSQGKRGDQTLPTQSEASVFGGHHHQRMETSSSSTSSTSSNNSTTNTGNVQKISWHNNFSLLGGKRNPINKIRKTSKALLTRQLSIDKSTDKNSINGIPASYQSRYGIRRSTLATSLPKVSFELRASRSDLCYDFTD